MVLQYFVLLLVECIDGQIRNAKEENLVSIRQIDGKTQEPPTSWAVGMNVSIHGLQVAAHLNGLHGVLDTFNEVGPGEDWG